MSTLCIKLVVYKAGRYKLFNLFRIKALNIPVLSLDYRVKKGGVKIDILPSRETMFFLVLFLLI